MSASDLQVGALHRYFIWSLHMRDHFREMGKAQGAPPKDPEEKRLWLIRPFMYMCLWFFLLFVVVEGYRDLGLSDPQSTPCLHRRTSKCSDDSETGRCTISATTSINALGTS